MTYRILRQIGTAANRPTATGSGLIYQCTDAMHLTYVDEPSSSIWKQFYKDGYTISPATAGSYTLVSATAGLSLSQTADAINVTQYNTGASGVSPSAKTEVALISASGQLNSNATWVVNFIGVFSSWAANYNGFGCVVTNGTTAGTSTGTAAYMFISGTPANGGYSFDTVTLDSARTANISVAPSTTDIARSRLLADGTNLHGQYSYDGVHWMNIGTIATPSGLNNYGFLMGCDVAATGSIMSGLVLQNQLTTLTVPLANVSTTTGNGVSPIVVTTTAAHNFITGDLVTVHGVGGNTAANSNTDTTNVGSGHYAWVIQVNNATQFKLLGSTGNGSFTTGGTAICVSR